MTKIPDENRKITQNNQRDILGHLWSSWNLDLASNLGKFRISPRTLLVTDSTDVSDFGTPVAFKFFDAKWWAVCGTQVFGNGGVPKGNYTTDSSTGAQTDYSADESDLEVFNGALYSTTTDALAKKASSGTGTGSWSLNGSALNPGTPHLLCSFNSRLYVTDLKTQIKSINTSDTMVTSGSGFIDLGNADVNTLSFMRASSDRIWIGVINRAHGKAIIYEWDGVSANVRKAYLLEAPGAMACVIKNDVPWVLDSNGTLLVWQGGAFIEKARLPIRDKFLFNYTSVDSGERFIHPNGMAVINNEIHLFIKNTIGDDGNTVIERLPSGVWAYNETNGLYHKYSLSLHREISGSVTDYGQVRINKAGALADAKTYSTAANDDGRFLVGAQFFSDATTTASGIFIDNSNDTKQKYGYFVTSKILSPNITEHWQRLLVRFRKFLTSTDKIIVKYRVLEETATELATITWVDTDTFTTATDVSGNVGDEVEILQGTGAGGCAHINSVTGSAPYTVNLDETFTGVTTGTAKARVQSWVKAGSYSGQTKNWEKFSLEKKEPWIQLKICLLWTGKNEIDDIM